MVTALFFLFLINLRIFSDENDKTNLNLSSVRGGLLIISQFTLYADCRHGNRPSFIDSGKPDLALFASYKFNGITNHENTLKSLLYDKAIRMASFALTS